MNKISVIIPVFNSEKTLERCLNSVINQTVSVDEIVLIDDCSQDDSGTICDKYSKEYPYIKAYHNLENKGVSISRNLGIGYSTCEWLAFIDSDDYVGKKYIETLLHNSSADFVTCGYWYETSHHEFILNSFTNENISTKLVQSNPSRYLGKYYFGAPWAKLYKREIVKSNKIRFNEKMSNGEDILFAFCYLRHTKTIQIVNEVPYYYTFQKSSLSHQLNADFWKWRIEQESAIYSFFQPETYSEKEFLLNRKFETLQTLIAQYESIWKDSDIKRLYTNPFFADAIRYKMNCGTKNEKKYLFLLSHNCYLEYQKFKQILIKIKKTALRRH